jgi:hypothetical protein
MSDMTIDQVRKTIGDTLKAFQRRASISQAYHAVYQTPAGQTVLHDLMRKGGVLETSVEANDSRFYEGRRSLALEICKELRWSESEMIALARETTKDDLERLVE